MTRILFVCMGNICRSPTAEAVFRALVAERGLEDRVEVDSAGTHAYHVGEAPDPRAQRAAAKRGVSMDDLRARRVEGADFERFDLILAMDEDNLRILEDMCPSEHQHKLRLFLDFAADVEVREVPDPYYGGQKGFEYVLDLVEKAAEGLLQEITRRQGA